METKVKDVYKIFIFPDDGLMQLTPKKDFEEALGKNTPRKPKILSGEVLLDSTEENGTQYILISKHATCTTIGDCRVVLDEGTSLPSPENK